MAEIKLLIVLVPPETELAFTVGTLTFTAGTLTLEAGTLVLEAGTLVLEAKPLGLDDDACRSDFGL